MDAGPDQLDPTGHDGPTPARLEPSVPFLGRGKATFFVRVTLPLAALGGLIASVFLVFPHSSDRFLQGLVAYMLPPAGKETIIPSLVGLGYDPFLVATYIAGLDMTVAWFLAWNWDIVTRTPGAGRAIERLMVNGKQRLAKWPALERSAFFGLILFVFIPVQGSGAVAGAILGRLVGLPPQRAWVAIMIGALTISFAWAYAADAVAEAIHVFGVAVVLQAALLLIGGLVLLTLITRRMIT